MATNIKHQREKHNLNLNANGMRFALIVSEWNSHITNNLFIGAKESLVSNNVNPEDIIRYNVPGSFELVYGAKIASQNNYNAIICLGSVIKGETKHFDYICNAVSNGIMNLNIRLNTPIIFGVLTDENEQQSLDRSGGKYGNKGSEAAITAIKMAILNS